MENSVMCNVYTILNAVKGTSFQFGTITKHTWG